MPSPFPGVDPYVENPEFWPEVHNRLIVAIADSLAPQLRPKYRVAIEKRTYLNDETESVLVGIADVAILRGRATPSLGTTTLTDRRRPPIQVTMPSPEEIQERYLEIREVAEGRVVTVLEILSPKNKRLGIGQTTYLQKRQQILASETHLVEIDLLRSGSLIPLQNFHSACYYTLVSRSDQRPLADLYPFHLQEEIPIFAIPLAPSEPEPEVDLQALYAAVYDRAGLDLVIDYRPSPIPSLPQEDADWADALLRQQGLRQ
jgi:Protein of unknown function (DUF4058)